MSAFHAAATPEDYLPHTHAHRIGGSDDRDLHFHRCRCGLAWGCQQPDCRADDACQRCEDAALTTYLDARQPVLEPVEALLAARKE